MSRAVTAEAIGWLQGLAAPKPLVPKAEPARFFGWVHLYDCHAPYKPPEPCAAGYAGRPYDGEVAWSDELVGRLIAAPRDAATLESSTSTNHGLALQQLGRRDEAVAQLRRAAALGYAPASKSGR